MATARQWAVRSPAGGGCGVVVSGQLAGCRAGPLASGGNSSNTGDRGSVAEPPATSIVVGWTTRSVVASGTADAFERSIDEIASPGCGVAVVDDNGISPTDPACVVP